MLPSSQFRDITIKDYLAILKRRIWVILACAIISTSWAALKTFQKVSLYKAAAKILIEKTMPQVLPMQQVYSLPTWLDKEYVQSQVDVLTSRSLARKVVDSLTEAGDNTFRGVINPEGAFLSGVSVTQQLGTQIINVGYISPDAVKAAKFANALTNTYIQQDVGKRTVAAKSATVWLEKELEDTRKKLQDSEVALNSYVQQHQIIAVANIETKTQTIIEGLKQDRVNIENELAELSKRYKEKYPKIIALKTRLSAVNDSINEETKKLLSLSEQMIEYNALKRELESSKSLYESLLKRMKETEVSKELETTNIHIIDLAEVPRGPFSPNRGRDILTGVMLGLFLGFGLAFVLEYLDSTVKTAEDIEMYVRLPFLGYVPTIAKAEGRVQKDLDLISSNLPNSHITEAYRSIRTSIIFSAPEDKPLKTLLITSTSPQEGKTTVTLNLGIVFSQANEKTIILEADMRKPRIANSLGIDSREGLSSFLTGVASLDAVIKKTSIPRLFILSCGPRPPNPAELLTSAKARSLIEELKNKFDRIIIDSPPVLTVTDASILANVVDGVIDVIRSGSLNIEFVLRGIHRLNEVKARIIGVVLNNVNVKKEDSYYYYHYYYAEDKEKKA